MERGVCYSKPGSKDRSREAGERRYGTPEKIHPDQRRSFEAQLFQEMCVLFNMEKTRTSPYHPESDGMVERMSRTLQDMLAKYVSSHHDGLPFQCTCIHAVHSVLSVVWP